MNNKDSAIIRKREAEVAQRLSPSWNGQDPKPVLSPEVITYGGTVKLTDLVPNQRLGHSLSC